MNFRTRVSIVLVSTFLILGAGIAISASAGTVSKMPSVSSTLITWEPVPGYHLSLDVSDAGRYDFAAGEAPILPLYDAAGQALADGSYTWRLTAAPELSQKQIEARRKGLTTGPKGYTESGVFSIVGGAFVDPTLVEGGAEKAQIYADDLIAQGSACIGVDCETAENFDDDTIRLKENNLRIMFDDTSDLAHYPSTDWQLVANSNANGGLSGFWIEDVTNRTTPFTVEAAAPNYTIYGEADGDVGIGTNDPERALHMVRGNSPELRLEQDGSAGFVAQSWDIGGNEQTFYVKDAEIATYPLAIEAAAPSDSIYVANTGFVGFGTQEPTRPIHITSDNQAHVAFQNTSSQYRWNVGANSASFIISRANSGSREIELQETGDIYFRFGAKQLAKLDKNGNLNISGLLTTGGTGCGGGCDMVFQPGYELETIEEHATFMWENSYLPAVGPTVENGEAWNLTEMTGGMLNELEKAHIYIEQLNDDLQRKDDRLDDLEKRLAHLERAHLEPTQSSGE